MMMRPAVLLEALGAIRANALATLTSAMSLSPIAPDIQGRFHVCEAMPGTIARLAIWEDQRQAWRRLFGNAEPLQ
jgi:hypothetical protein